MIDYLIVGSGLYGSVFAREMKDAGKSVIVLEKRSHIGGNCYTENMYGINVHKYGPHIFHTSNKEVWEYINKFTTFNHFSYRPKVKYERKLYSFPINLMTIYQVFGVDSPFWAKTIIDDVKIPNDNPQNLEEWMLSQVGEKLYNIFIKGYTTKQWGRDPKVLPASIIKRIPIRFTFDDNYYFDNYQGIPIGGYTQMFEKLLVGIEIRLNTNFFDNRDYFIRNSKKIVYTGSIDEFFDYKFGELDYRSLKFETEILDIKDFQGNAGINYTDIKIPFTRIVEHKHFEFGDQSQTIITKEYPSDTGEPYYPINSDGYNPKMQSYIFLTEKTPHVIFGGRLGEYKYMNMDQVIASALDMVKKEKTSM